MHLLSFSCPSVSLKYVYIEQTLKQNLKDVQYGRQTDQICYNALFVPVNLPWMYVAAFEGGVSFNDFVFQWVAII